MSSPGDPDAAVPLPILDVEHLRKYTLGNRDLEREVLELFLEELPRTVQKLQSATSPRDWHLAAHTLKGSARAVGALAVAACAETAELTTDIADTQARAAVIAAIVKAADCVAESARRTMSD